MCRLKSRYYREVNGRPWIYLESNMPDYCRVPTQKELMKCVMKGDPNLVLAELQALLKPVRESVGVNPPATQEPVVNEEVWGKCEKGNRIPKMHIINSRNLDRLLAIERAAREAIEDIEEYENLKVVPDNDHVAVNAGKAKALKAALEEK